MSMKNSNNTIGNRTRDLPARSAMPQPTAPPGDAPLSECACLSPGVKRWRNESNHSTSSSVESKNMLIHTSTSPYTFTAPRRMNFLTVTLAVTCPVFNVSYPYKTRAFGRRPMSEAHLINVTCWQCHNSETSCITEWTKCILTFSLSTPVKKRHTLQPHSDTYYTLTIYQPNINCLTETWHPICHSQSCNDALWCTPLKWFHEGHVFNALLVRYFWTISGKVTALSSHISIHSTHRTFCIDTSIHSHIWSSITHLV
jgi:hypothetical protein